MKKILISATIVLSSLTGIALAGHYTSCPSASNLQQVLANDNVTGVLQTARVPFCQFYAKKTTGDVNCQAIVSDIKDAYQANGIKCNYHPAAEAYRILVSHYRG